MATVIKVTSKIDNRKGIEAHLMNGLTEEKKRTSYAINKTEYKLIEFEKRFNKTTSQFLEEFKQGLIEETPDIFEWWAESKLLTELKSALDTLNSIEICPQ